MYSQLFNNFEKAINVATQVLVSGYSYSDEHINDELKKREDIKPVGFAIDDMTLYLTNSDGKMILADLSIGNIKSAEKVSGDIVSKPFIFNQNLFVIRNGSIVQYN